MRSRAKMLVVVGIVALALTSAGCGRSFTLEKELVSKSQAFTQDFAARRFEAVLPVLTGDALESVKAALPLLQSANLETKVTDWSGKVDFMNRSKDRASVDLSYIQEQTVPGYGTTTTKMNVVYDWKKLAGAWRIYEIKLVHKDEGK
ncbi:MAG: hypothetical protein ACYC9Q_05375 [Bacillota bacterium]